MQIIHWSPFSWHFNDFDIFSVFLVSKTTKLSDIWNYVSLWENLCNQETVYFVCRELCFYKSQWAKQGKNKYLLHKKVPSISKILYICIYITIWEWNNVLKQTEINFDGRQTSLERWILYIIETVFSFIKYLKKNILQYIPLIDTFIFEDMTH